ncbi:Metallo-dependent phosphatase [Cystobasidium minutum MCA 4210]|uniref:Metallo-dependent phosphatase n=1 Tax=Cystobasidium minutum MCA 4210 TaxID=1397322 RepID=UPI0034CD6397|eukprot:jgi/Rhomi1/156230/estExt_Genewise1.C_110034
MVLVLVIGDLHIPIRSHDLPLKFKKLLVPGKIQQVLLTGNVCDGETLEWLRGICNGDVRAVRGDWDDLPTAPPSQIITHGPLRIGIVHGHQVVPLGDTESLSAVARSLDVDILVSGATHKFEAFEFEGRFFLNPGSATGAFTFAKLGNTSGKANEKNGAAENDEDKENKQDGGDSANADSNAATQATKATANPDSVNSTIPSFALMDIQGSNVVTYVYQLVEGEVKVERVEFRKD